MTRKLLTMCKKHHAETYIDRLHVERKEGRKVC